MLCLRDWIWLADERISLDRVTPFMEVLLLLFAVVLIIFLDLTTSGIIDFSNSLATTSMEPSEAYYLAYSLMSSYCEDVV